VSLPEPAAFSNLTVHDFDLDGEITNCLKTHLSTPGIQVVALAKMDAVRKTGSFS
jgi:hypothetical protein